MNVEKINQLLEIEESYKAPQKLMEKLNEDPTKLFCIFLEVENDLSYDWFGGYFENEHADRKNKKQDFTPQSISVLLNKLVGQGDTYFEAACGTGSIMIKNWIHNRNSFFQVEELSDRAVPFLLFNMAIRNMNGLVQHGDSLTGEFKAVYRIQKEKQFGKILKWSR